MAGKHHDDEPTQKTQPQKGEPVEIPVPKRDDFERLLKKAAHPKKTSGTEDHRQGG